MNKKIDKTDWRLQGQEKYLKDAMLTWKKYQKLKPTRDHDHCVFYGIKFMEQKTKDILDEGYTTEDNYHWICKSCYDDFQRMFNWHTSKRQQTALKPKAACSLPLQSMDIIKAHRFSSRHRRSISFSKKCGCFYCFKIFTPREIKDWIDEDEKGKGQTAICPYCGIDSVIGDYDVKLNMPLLRKMKKRWF